MNSIWTIAFCGVLLSAVAGCRSHPASVPVTASVDDSVIESPAAATRDADQVEAVSLLGRNLVSPALPAEVLEKRQRELADAQHVYDRDPHDEQATIWLGRRLAYLGKYRQAIHVFTNGLAIHPESTRLLRHRGHRYITIRRFDDALADLAKAATLIADTPDEVEPDGQPNVRDQPRSSLHTNVLYHLGLTQYLKGDFEAASRTFHQCLQKSDNDDMRVASAYWLYLATSRSGTNQAWLSAALNSVGEEPDIIENHTYWHLLRLFGGHVAAEGHETKPPAADDASIDKATLGYGLGAWHMINGRHESATREFRRVIDSTNWAAFGHIASETEIARRQARP